MSANTNSIEALNNKIALLEAEVSQLKNQYGQAALFIDKILNSLPGIFYLYQKSGDFFYLKRWNKNHADFLGYTHQELLDKKPQDFFDEKNLPLIEKALSDIFQKKGSVQVKANILTKNNNRILYLFEGYYFEDDGAVFFLGMGMDISGHDRVKTSLQKMEQLNKEQELEKRKLDKQLDVGKRKLIALALQNSKTGSVISSAHKHIKELQSSYGDSVLLNEVTQILRMMGVQSANTQDWEVFNQQFVEIHQDFHANLKTLHPLLTKSELKFCAFLRIQMSSAQIASALNVTSEAIKKTRYRIRKKIELDSKASLEDYLLKI